MPYEGDPIIKANRAEMKRMERDDRIRAKREKEAAEFSKAVEELDNDEFYLKNFKPNEYEKRKREGTI